MAVLSSSLLFSRLADVGDVMWKMAIEKKMRSKNNLFPVQATKRSLETNEGSWWLSCSEQVLYEMCLWETVSWWCAIVTQSRSLLPLCTASSPASSSCSFLSHDSTTVVIQHVDWTSDQVCNTARRLWKNDVPLLCSPSFPSSGNDQE